MKQFISIFCTMLAVLTGCRQEEPVRENCGKIFRAVTEGLSSYTKTTLGTDMSSLWSAGDEVAIFAGNCSMGRYMIDERSAGSSSGIFNLIEEGQDSGENISANIAIYPYQESLTCSVADDSSYQLDGFDYPSVQHYRFGSFAEDSYVMAAVTDGTADRDLVFRNVGGAIRFQIVGNDEISRITITGKSGEKLSGDATLTVYLDGTMPSVQMGQFSHSVITLDCGNGVQLNPYDPVSFHIAMPPTSFDNGFIVELENVSGHKCTLEASASNAVGRSQILCMPVARAEFGDSEVLEGDYVDEYGINWGQGTIIDGLRWAPVNCGYKGKGFSDKGYLYGKMFQWGRLNGVGYDTYHDCTEADKVEGGSIAIAEANIPANANTFYTMNSTENQSHWFSDTEIKGVWNAGTATSPVKSAYDPCPEGWRMPTQAEMKCLTSRKSAWAEVNGQSGYWFSGLQPYADGVPAIFLPAAGYISSNGQAQDRNTYGTYWTSTVNASDNLISQLTFSPSDTGISLSGSSYGKSVRCVAEANTQSSDKKSISILFVGNSLTQDGIAYLPYMLKNYYPEIDFKIYMWYFGGYTLNQQYQKFTSNGKADIFSVAENSQSWKNHSKSKTMASVLSTYKFDIVCMQEYFNYKSEYTDVGDWENCQAYIESKYKGGNDLEFISLFHAPLRSRADEVFSMTEAGNALILQTTDARDMIPNGIAVYRALMTDLDRLGDKQHLSPDGTHTQEGLPCLLQTYVTLCWIFDRLGINKTVYGHPLRMTNDIYKEISVPGANLGSGVVKGTDAQYILAQEIAINAYREGKEFVRQHSKHLSETDK